MSACAPAPAEMTEAQRAEVEASARAAFDGLVAAMGAADQEGVLSYMAEGSIIAFHGMVWDRGGLATTLDAFYSGIERSDMDNFAPLQFDVLGPNTVVVTSQNSQMTTYKDAEMEPLNAVSARTFVLIREGESWKVLHGHISQHLLRTD
jgi:ketosteroid isomerase-like protein